MIYKTFDVYEAAYLVYLGARSYGKRWDNEMSGYLYCIKEDVWDNETLSFWLNQYGLEGWQPSREVLCEIISRL